MNENPSVIIHTDGACRGNPGPGGWAAILTTGRQEKSLSGGESQTTNNRMELTAALEALRALKQPFRVEIFTDSAYVKRGVTEWMEGWKARNWKRKEGKLANVDLWQALDDEINRHDVTWQWVKGHASNCKNEQVDRLARKAIPRG